VLNVQVYHAWGMTETSPLASISTILDKYQHLPLEDKLKILMKQGLCVYGVEMKIVNEKGQDLPHDGIAFGDLLVRGPWIASGYYKDPGPLLLEGNWMPTGDVATIDRDGYMQITDRSKDVIKSGGEWISSIDLENQVMGHPDVQEAAVIGLAHSKWDERPLLIVIKKPDAQLTKEELLKYISGKVAKWWIPDDVVFVNTLPHTATGKLWKAELRKTFKSYQWPESTIRSML